jgi:hypothetical protein
MSQSVTKAERAKSLSVNRFHKSDSVPFSAFDVHKVSLTDLVSRFKISEGAAKAIVAARKSKKLNDLSALLRVKELRQRDLDVLRRCGYAKNDVKFAITDVQPHDKYIYSYKAFSLKISVLNPSLRKLSVVSTKVFWMGKPFIVEKEISPAELEQGIVALNFNENQTLPPGPASFHVDIFDSEGGQSSFRVTCAVLPSNPLSLSLSPESYYVTGSYSLRGYYNTGSDSFTTVVKISIFNGNSFGVTMSRFIKWAFWDGGVGGSLVESNTHDLGGNFTVGANSTWSVTLYVTSPHGSGIYNRYADKEDMTIKIEMNATSGTVISDTITARVMLAFGVDIIRVAGDTFIGQEYTDLYDAVDVTKAIYEARDITIRSIGRYNISDSAAGSYKFINSDSECHNLFNDWTAYDSTGLNVDVFVAHNFVDVGFDGLAGGIPGPMNDSGSNSGVAVSKTGFVDGSGTKRLSVDYLGMLIGHEVGHFLGLVHISESGNLLLSSSGTNDTNLNYDQYRTISDYGRVVVF